jgi:oxygen-independent coproporphyrinogen-3 oxidase
MHLYLHVPFCRSKCDYCAFYSVTDAAAATRAAYPVLLLRELDLHLQAALPPPPPPPAQGHSHCGGPPCPPAGAVRAARMPPPPPQAAAPSIATLYTGGGTPGLLGIEGFRRLADGLRARSLLADIAEWTVELNPASTTSPLLDTLRAAGVTRLSFGAQCFEDAILRRIGRRHTAAATRRALADARRAGFDNLGLDLIAGLPGMTPSGWRETLRQALDLGCAHLSVYGLGLEPGTRLQAAAQAGMLTLPDTDAQMDALAEAETILAAGGFTRYEISNYARPGMACRHNLAVWRGEDYLGLGPAAASRIGRRRWTNLSDLSAYTQALEADTLPPRSDFDELDAEADALERFAFGVRLGDGISPAAAARARPVLAPRVAEWEACLTRLAAQGITEEVPGTSDRRWRLTPRGREVTDAVIRDLL